MMTRTLPLFYLALVAACADRATGPTSAPTRQLPKCQTCTLVSGRSIDILFPFASRGVLSSAPFRQFGL